MTQETIAVTPAMVRLVEASTLQRAIEHLLTAQCTLAQADQWASTLATATPPSLSAVARAASYEDSAKRIDAIVSLLNAALTNATSSTADPETPAAEPEPDATGPADAYGRTHPPERDATAPPTHDVRELIGFSCNLCKAVFQALANGAKTTCPSCGSEDTTRATNVVSIQKRARQ